MVAFKVQNFGGMVPSVDPSLLQENQATNAVNTWLYSGGLQGINTLTLLRSVPAGTTRSFRIPYSNPNSFNISNSFWMDFQTADTDVVRSPTLDDQYQRYYWASPTSAPLYNTQTQIVAGGSPYFLGINPPGTIGVTATDTNAPATRTGNTHSSTVLDGLSTTSDLLVGDVVTGTGIVASPPTIIQTIPTTSSVTLSQAALSTTIGVNITFGTNGLTVSRAYVCTWVSAYGEESAPCTPTVVSAPNTYVWNITLPAVDPGDLGTNRNLVSTNIYRTVTSSNGVASYFLVATVPIAQTTYADSLTDTVVSANQTLVSTDWTPPPSYLQGFCKLPNGIIAGFGSGVNGNEIWFCEPYRPHAWPASYALVVDFPVVGLGVVDQTLVVCTEAYPIIISGSTPSNMVQSNLSGSVEPCLSRGSILSTPTGVLYTSPNGLVQVSYNGVVNTTAGLVQKDKWQTLVPTQGLRAARLQAGYYGVGIEYPAAFNPLAFSSAFFTTTDDSTATEGMYVDATTPSIGFTTMQATSPLTNIWNDVWSGEVFAIQGGNLYWLNLADPNPTLMPYTWTSKTFMMSELKNLGVARVYFDVPANTPAQNPTRNTSFPQTTLQSGQYGIFSMWASGGNYAQSTLIMTREIRTSGELMRLPAGYKADYIQFGFQAIVRIKNFQIAASAKELMQV